MIPNRTSTGAYRPFINWMSYTALAPTGYTSVIKANTVGHRVGEYILILWILEPLPQALRPTNYKGKANMAFRSNCPINWSSQTGSTYSRFSPLRTLLNHLELFILCRIGFFRLLLCKLAYPLLIWACILSRLFVTERRPFPLGWIQMSSWIHC